MQRTKNRSPNQKNSNFVPKEDRNLVERWLRAFSGTTRSFYQFDIERFFRHTKKPAAATTPSDVQDFMLAVKGGTATQSRALAAVKSLFRFAVLFGFLESNPAAPVKAPKVVRRLGERYLSEAEVEQMIEQEQDQRNKLLLKTLYMTGLRVSELCSLNWSEVEERPEVHGAQFAVMGKGEKKRSVLVSRELWEELQHLRNGERNHGPVFVSRTGQALDRSQVMRIVQAAAKRAGIKKNVSPHWLRHAHATHSIAAGAPLHVVQQTLGHSSLSVTGLYLHARPQESSSLYLKKGGDAR